MKKDISKIIFTILSVIMLCGIGFLGGRLTYKIVETPKTGYCLVKPLVYDAYTGEPLANATVTNTADGRQYITDSTGSTDWIAIYYDENDEIKLNAFIAEQSGYKKTLLYMVCETGRDPLDGPLIYMFTGDETDELISMVYSPSDEYSKKLSDRFTEAD